MPKSDVKGYEIACGAVVLEILIAEPDKFAAKDILVVLLKLGFFKKGIKYFKEY